DSQRFARSTHAEMPGQITDSLINAARILEYQQEYRRASTYYQRAAERLTDTAEQRNARFRVAEMAFKSRDWSGAVTAMQAFINRYSGDRSATELLVLAHHRIAQAREEQRAREASQREALEAVVRAYDRFGGQPGSMAAEYAASSRFRLVDPAIEDLESLSIAPGRQ